MIKIDNVEVHGLSHAIRGMRNPKNSWEKSDSGLEIMNVEDVSFGYEPNYEFIVGENDHKLMMSLSEGGAVHAKYRRMIAVYLDITAPLYWWKEFDTYKVGTVANSCSTMHKLTAKEFELADFSVEDVFTASGRWQVERTVGYLNTLRDVYLNGGELLTVGAGHLNYLTSGEHFEPKDKRIWREMIQLLPSSYNQKRTVMLNYEVLNNIYVSRKNHKLTEWQEFCKWIESLPYSEVITLG